MSIRNSASTASRLKILSGVFDYNAPYTLGGWVQLTVDRNSPSSLFCIVKNNAGSGNETGDYVWTESDGTSMRASCYNNGAVTATTGTNWTAGVWRFVMLVRESASLLKMYLDGALDATVSRDVSSRAAATQLGLTVFIGPTSTHTAALNGRISNLFAYTRALAIDEMKSQMYLRRPVSWDALYGYWNFWTDTDARLIDQSGQGHNFSLDGTLAYEDDPPIAVGGRTGMSDFAREAVIIDVSVSVPKLLAAQPGGLASSKAPVTLTKHLFASGAGGAQALAPVTLTKHLFASGAGGAQALAPVTLTKHLFVTPTGALSTGRSITLNRKIYVTPASLRNTIGALSVAKVMGVTTGRVAGLQRTVTLNRVQLVTTALALTRATSVTLNRVMQTTQVRIPTIGASVNINRLIGISPSANRQAAAALALVRYLTLSQSGQSGTSGALTLNRVQRIVAARQAALTAGLSLNNTRSLIVGRAASLSGALTLQRLLAMGTNSLQAQSAAVNLTSVRSLTHGAIATVRAPLTLSTLRQLNTNRQAAAVAAIAIGRVQRVIATVRQQIGVTVTITRVLGVTSVSGRYVSTLVTLTAYLRTTQARSVTIAGAASLSRVQRFVALQQIFAEAGIALTALFVADPSGDVIDLEASVPLERMLLIAPDGRIWDAPEQVRIFLVPSD